MDSLGIKFNSRVASSFFCAEIKQVWAYFCEKNQTCLIPTIFHDFVENSYPSKFLL